MTALQELLRELFSLQFEAYLEGIWLLVAILRKGRL